MSTTIMVATHGDDEPTRDALTLGVQLARLLEGDLVLAGVWASPLGQGDGLYEGLVKEPLQLELRELRATVPDDVSTRTKIQGSTSVVRGLHKVAAEQHADVLVLGPSRLHKGARAFRGDVALGIAHDAPCAVAVAPEGLRDRAPGAKDVVLAWDDSDAARAALETAVALAQGTGGTLRIVFVVEPPYRYGGPVLLGAGDQAAWEASLHDLGEEVIAAGTKAVAGRVPVTGASHEGAAAPLLAAAAADAAFLVAGSRGYGAVRRLVLGTTTGQLLEETTVPVVLVPRPE